MNFPKRAILIRGAFDRDAIAVIFQEIFKLSNPFANRVPSLSGPATDIVPVTPDDANDLAETAIALYSEGAGTISFVTAKGNQRSVGVAANAIMPVGAQRVLATGTTATGIHAMVIS